MNEQTPQNPPAPLTPAEERQWAMFAHLGVLVNLITGFLGLVVPLIIYVVYKDRSRFVAFHSLQAFVMQLVCSFGGVIIAGVVALVGSWIPVVNLLCCGLSICVGLLPVIGFFYGIYGGLQVNQGNDFRYWLVGDWVEKTFMGAPS